MAEPDAPANFVPLTLRSRLESTPALHRAFPRRAGAAYAHLRTERWWAADPRARSDARDQMDMLLGCTGQPLDLDELGRRYMYETLRRDELMWRPWLVEALPVERLDVLRETHAQGRGVILSFAHHGQYSGVFPSIARHGLPVHVAIAQWLHTQNTPTYNGRFWRQHIKVVGSHGARLFPAVTGASAVMGSLLAAGDIVAIASDVAGSTSTTFMGRPVKTASGAARLALTSGAPILPVTVHRGGKVQVLRIEDALQIDPAMEVPAVLAAILSAQEAAVAEWPEAYHWPTKRFGLVQSEDKERFGFPPNGYFQRYRV